MAGNNSTVKGQIRGEEGEGDRDHETRKRERRNEQSPGQFPFTQRDLRPREEERDHFLGRGNPRRPSVN